MYTEIFSSQLQAINHSKKIASFALYASIHPDVCSRRRFRTMHEDDERCALIRDARVEMCGDNVAEGGGGGGDLVSRHMTHSRSISFYSFSNGTWPAVCILLFML